MEKGPLISIVIVSFNTKNLLRDCVKGLLKECVGINNEIFVVDNASKDGSAEMIEKEFPFINLIKSPVNLGFAAGNNTAFLKAKGKYVVLLNSDAFIQKGSLQISIDKMEANSKIGLAGAKLIGEDGSWQPSARMFPSILNKIFNFTGLAQKYSSSRIFGRFDRTWASQDLAAEIDWVPGAFSIIRRDVLERVGRFDERYFLYYEEVDLCKRIKNAGYEIWYFPDVIVVHIGGSSAKTINKVLSAGSQIYLWQLRSELLYFRKFHGFVGAYLSMQSEVLWNRVRILKNRLFKNPNNDLKITEAKSIISVLKRAWKDTQGGTISPTRPW